MTIPKPSISVSDSIHFKSIDTGGNSAGNGGDGVFKGYVVNQPVLSFDPSNTASGSSVTANAGDQVHQKASWDADASAMKAHGVTANSNGDQSSSSGHDTASATANTTATQTNSLMADLHQEVMAGIGGNGGDGNAAMGGNVDISFDSSI